MRIRYKTSGDEVIDIATSGMVRIDTGKGSITVGVFNDGGAQADGFQVVMIEGDKTTTWLKFNGQSLL